jgi:hypothetical protein
MRRARVDRSKEREAILLQEKGAGISDLCLGAANKYAPTLAWEARRETTIEERHAEGRNFLPYYQLADKPSEECRDALAVWRPLPLRHLLLLDPAPPLSLLDTRQAVTEAEAELGRYQEMEDRLDALRPVLMALLADPRVRSLSSTHAAIRDVINAGTTGALDPEDSLTREDAFSEKALTIEHVDHILFYLGSDVRKLRDQTECAVKRARTDLASVTGAEEWNADQSRRVSRRLTTLCDSLRRAYPDGRWSWSRLATLIRKSQTDWTTPPCPALATKNLEKITAGLKMRERREKRRWSRLKLTEQDVYPWLRRRNNLGRSKRT